MYFRTRQIIFYSFFNYNELFNITNNKGALVTVSRAYQVILLYVNIIIVGVWVY